jgi:DNA-binding CsgD family transcriptional regulator
MLLPPTELGNPVGRTAESRILVDLLGGVDRRGGALVLRGDPGIGKSRLLAEAVAYSRAHAMHILAATGVQSEANVAFAGLQQLLRPLRALQSTLPASHRDALEAALGVGRDHPPELFRIALAVLDLLAEAAAERPLLVVAEDAQWLDQPSVDVLTFVARRLESDPIILLAAVREGYPTAFRPGELPELTLQPLDPVAAGQLLDRRAPTLSNAQRAKVLLEASGNPLALVELPSIADHLATDLVMPGLMPLTERMERAFAARAADLPAPTQLLLLVAALNDAESLAEVLRTGAVLAGAPVEASALQPAADVAIIELDERTVGFRHPLMRSAVSQAAPVNARRRVHEALAEVLADQPDRRVWHRAALISGHHEEIASELEDAAERARRRGAAGVAIVALRRAAELSRPDRRLRPLLEAAVLAYELGQPEMVFELLGEAEQLVRGPIERARMTWLEVAANTIVHIRPIGSAPSTRTMIEQAEVAGAQGARDLHVDLLSLAALRASWFDLAAETREPLRDALERVGPPEPADPRLFAAYVYLNPYQVPVASMERLREMASHRSYNRQDSLNLGAAAFNAGAFDVADVLVRDAVDVLRESGRLGALPRMLTLLGLVAARLGDWNTAIPAAEEARRLAAELGVGQWHSGADAVDCVIAGMRGDEAAAEATFARAEQVGIQAHANVAPALALPGRVLAALGASRHARAFQIAERIFDPADPAHHPAQRCWVIGDLAEAAVGIDRRDAGRERLREVERLVGDRPETWVAIEIRYARAILATDPVMAAEHFDDALRADLSRWPFQRARVLLAYGRWLRRERRVTESRPQLRAARDTFDALGCATWGDQARAELRASGESSRGRGWSLRDQLTPQELQIAQLAADGLSNREIGQKLYVSPRTISTHLYRIFPKLQVVSRNQLSSALSGLSADIRGPAAPGPAITRD